MCLKIGGERWTSVFVIACSVVKLGRRILLGSKTVILKIVVCAGLVVISPTRSTIWCCICRCINGSLGEKGSELRRRSDFSLVLSEIGAVLTARFSWRCRRSGYWSCFVKGSFSVVNV